MRFTFSFIATLAICILCSGLASAQNTSIRLIDSNTEKGMPYANVVLYKLDGNYFKGLTTDGNGQASFDLTDRVTYKISFIGYESMEGQISKGEHLTLEMIEQSDILDAVVVTGQYGPQKADNSIYKINVVDSRQMEQRGVNNLAEALSQETFIRLSEDPSTGTSIEMQGMGGENVKYLIDGVPIVGRVDGNIDLSQINMNNVDHIEIVQGPMSVVYGTSALAGVINIITKKNATSPNVFKVNGFVDNKKHYNFGFYGSIIRGKNTITASGSRNMFQGIDTDLIIEDNNTTGKNRYMEFKPKLVYNADLAYAYSNRDFRIELKTDYMRSELRHYSNPNPYTLIAYDNNYITKRSINTITLTDKLSEILSYNVVGAYTNFHRDTENITSDLSELTHIKTSTASTLFNNMMTRGNFTLVPKDAQFSYQFGWDINYDKGTGDRIDDENAYMADYAVFASAQWDPLKSLTIQPGLRGIYNTKFETPLIPSINLQWRIIEDLSFRVSYAKGFRAPSLKELYLDFHDSNHNLTGNPDLKAETTNSYNGSLSYRFRQEKYYVRVESSVFYNDGKDAITLIVTDPEANAAENTNLGGRRTSGLNFNVAFVLYSGLDLSAGYSLTRESYDYLGDDNWTPLVKYSNYTFNAKYNLKELNMTFMANYKLYGTTPFLTYDNNDEPYFAYTDHYSDLEATISKQLFNNRLDIVIGGKNLMNNYGIRTYGYKDRDIDGDGVLDPESENPNNFGRTYFIKANYRF